MNVDFYQLCALYLMQNNRKLVITGYISVSKTTGCWVRINYNQAPINHTSLYRDNGHKHAVALHNYTPQSKVRNGINTGLTSLCHNLAVGLKDLAGMCTLVQKPVHLFLQSNIDLACVFHAAFNKHIKVKWNSLKQLQETFIIMQIICPTNTSNEVFILLQHFSNIINEKGK